MMAWPGPYPCLLCRVNWDVEAVGYFGSPFFGLAAQSFVASSVSQFSIVWLSVILGVRTSLFQKKVATRDEGRCSGYSKATGLNEAEEG